METLAMNWVRSFEPPSTMARFRPWNLPKDLEINKHRKENKTQTWPPKEWGNWPSDKEPCVSSKVAWVSRGWICHRFLSAVSCLLRAQRFLHFLSVFFPPRSGNPTKHKLDFKGTCLACSGHHEMRVQRWHPKGKESLEDADHWSRDKGNAQESTNTPQKGTGTRNLLDFSWKIPQASPAASELKWLRKKKKKSGKGASQRDLLEKKEGKEKWLNSILLILKANSSCLS